ncbi:unnamed protein product [Polarella glacialis]|uniref:Uncharacterized protein n=1 Tax=Polarella glacialis TaxID=89957 RepID=A0A813JLW7_POLGL|nr:unnamed protein product [Polarella glacialis]
MAFFMGGGSPAHMMMGSGFPVMGGGFPSGGGLVEIQTEDGSCLVVGRQHLQGIMEGRLVNVKIDGENVLMDKEKAIMLREGHEGRRSQSGGRESHLGGNTRKHITRPAPRLQRAFCRARRCFVDPPGSLVAEFTLQRPPRRPKTSATREAAS